MVAFDGPALPRELHRALGWWVLRPGSGPWYTLSALSLGAVAVRGEGVHLCSGARDRGWLRQLPGCAMLRYCPYHDRYP